MKIAKITVFEDGKSVVTLKDGLFGEYYWGDEFDDVRKAKDYTKSMGCTFTLVEKSNGDDDSVNNL
jgi:hypothetical protein